MLLLHCRACRAQQTRFCSFVQTSRLGKIPPPGSLLIGWSADNQPMRWRESATTVEWDPPKSKFSRSSHLMGQRTSAGRLKQTYPVFPVATSSQLRTGVRRGLVAGCFNISCFTTICTALHCPVIKPICGLQSVRMSDICLVTQPGLACPGVTV